MLKDQCGDISFNVQVEGGGGLQSRLAELESELVQVREERAASQRQLESTCHELTVAHATLEQMQVHIIGSMYSVWASITYTVEPPNFGANSIVSCREVVPISEVK